MSGKVEGWIVVNSKGDRIGQVHDTKEIAELQIEVYASARISHMSAPSYTVQPLVRADAQSVAAGGEVAWMTTNGRGLFAAFATEQECVDFVGKVEGMRIFPVFERTSALANKHGDNT